LNPAASKDAVLWTIDGGNRVRRYTLKELRTDLSRKQVDAKGEALGPDQPAPMAFDRSGRAYGVRWNGTGMELFVNPPPQSGKKPRVPSRDVNSILPSPDGGRFVVSTGRGEAMALRAYDAHSMEEIWAVAQGPGSQEIVWSPDGRFVAIAANTGAVVLDAATGEPVRRRCGLDFASTGAPPTTAFNATNRPSICE
jgi:hypothetical protein